MGIFNMDKLPEYTADFKNAEIAVFGCGAVGSAVVEKAVKMGVEKITVIDFDPLEAENISKSSSLYRYPEDIGQNKAIAFARRANELLGKDAVHGIDANVTMFGPMVFAGFDAILAPLDNYAAKIYVNQLWRQIPDEMRPELIVGGTIGENAQSNSLDGNGPCLRCLLSEDWVAKDPLARSSCTGPQYRNEERAQEIVRTTGLASGNSASFMAEQLRCRLLGIREATNKSIMYSPFPNMELSVVTPMARKGCPDCKSYRPPVSLDMLSGCDVMSLTAGELMDKLDAILGLDEYGIMLPEIEFAGTTYSKLIADDYCKACGRKMTGLYRHEFRTRYNDLRCETCRSEGKKVSDSYRTTHIGRTMRAITKRDCVGQLRNRTLFELGWPLGGFIRVVTHNSACTDIMDPEFRKEYTFFCQNDKETMKKVKRLEG